MPRAVFFFFLFVPTPYLSVLPYLNLHSNSSFKMSATVQRARTFISVQEQPTFSSFSGHNCKLTASPEFDVAQTEGYLLFSAFHAASFVARSSVCMLRAGSPSRLSIPVTWCWNILGSISRRSSAVSHLNPSQQCP